MRAFSSVYFSSLYCCLTVFLLDNHLEAGLKKDDRRIRWADSSGQALAVSGEEPISAVPETITRKSRWSERKKKDMQHEKALLLKSR